MGWDLESALDLAREMHAGASDKAGEAYIDHVMRVVAAVETPDQKMAAALHDVVEDSPVTLDGLRDVGCPPTVVSAVDALTRRHDEPYEVFIERAAANRVARQVKIADLADNADETRLARLPAADAARLRDKYARAIAALGAEDEVAAIWARRSETPSR